MGLSSKGCSHARFFKELEVPDRRIGWRPMSYRDPASALVSRRERLVAELAAARRAADELVRTVERVPRLEKELAEIDGLLARGDARPPPSLDNVRVASPCKADWNGMVGDDRARFCAQCGNYVYNLSGMAREEAEAFLREIEAAPCVRFFRRADGTVLTSDCPVGLRRKRRKQAAVAAGISLLPGVAGLTVTTFAPSERPAAPVVDRSPEAEPVPHDGTRAEREGIELAGILAEHPDWKRADPKPKIADEKGCSPPYTVDVRSGKKTWKLACL